MPNVSQYLEALIAPLFRTLGEVSVVPGVMIAGRNAVIFKLVTAHGEFKSLKCFLRRPQFPEEVYGYIAACDSPCWARMAWLPQELWVYDERGEGAWADVALGEWVDGKTLETIADQADTETMGRLAGNFDELARTLLAQEWAHGDLKPENIIVGAEGKMTPIDYDAMFIPALAGRQTRELGTTPWQHPARDSSLFDSHIDDYAIVLLSVSLHALARWPELRGDDYWLLDPTEVVAGRSTLWSELLGRWERLGEQRLALLTRLLASPSPCLPDLSQIMHIGVSCIESTDLELFIERGKWGYRSRQEVAIRPQYDRAFDFSEGLAAVRLGATWHFIDVQNRIVLNGSAWRQAKPFHEGLAAIQVDEKWGYITPDGRWAFEPQFDRAWNFRDGRARVVEAGREFTIDRPKTTPRTSGRSRRV